MSDSRSVVTSEELAQIEADVDFMADVGRTYMRLPIRTVRRLLAAARRKVRLRASTAHNSD